MVDGIYIVANDRVLDQSIALLKSIRQHDAETPVVMIPYDDHYQEVASRLAPLGVTVYENLEFLEQLTQKLCGFFEEGFFAKPNKLRKQACWFGDFDRFLYIDTDIVVFEKIIDTLAYLADYDFIYSDYQHRGGITDVFSPNVLEAGIFTEADCQDVFNTGFWASKKHLFSEADLYDLFAECAAHTDYFDFSHQTNDQPLINYMVLKCVPKRFNLVRRPGGGPGNWAGSTQFIVQDHHLIDPNSHQTLQFLHWAGLRIAPGCPYWDIWAHYRYLNEPMPEWTPQPTVPTSLWKRVMRKLTAIQS